MILLRPEFWRKTARLGLDVLFPRTCAVCTAPCHDDHPHLCKHCRDELRFVMAQPACPRCAHTIGPFGMHEGRCHACRHRNLLLDQLVRVAAYRDEMAPLIRAFKYGGRDALDSFLGRLLADALHATEWAASVDALVCVPTHWTHAVGRHDYRPKLLIRAVSRVTGIPIAPVLRRTAGGPHQFDVPRAQRSANVHGKFAMFRGAAVDGARLCLIDDVSTTGATVNECARVLKRAGATAVYAAVVGKVDTATRPALPRAGPPACPRPIHGPRQTGRSPKST